MRSCVFAVAVSTLVLAAAAEEKFDWEQKGTIRQDAAASAADAKLPRVLILGDSISLGYTPIVVKKMKDRAFVTRPKTNCGPSSFYLSGGNLEKWLGDGKWDVIHVNFGIWDNHYIKGGPCDMDLYWGSGYKDVTGDLAQDWAIRGEGFHLRATVKDYERNLRTILARLKRTGAKVVFGLTTPLQGWQSHETNGHLDADNEIAEAVCEEMGVKVNDLHAVACWHLGDQTDGCHFNQAGYAVLADRVVEAIDDALAKGTTVVNVRDVGAKGDNRADDAPAIQKALDTAARPLEVVVPPGTYYLDGTAKVGSDTTIRCEPGARIVLSAARPHRRGEFLLTNRNKEAGDRNIRLVGGVWDGDSQKPNNQRKRWDGRRESMTPERWSGALLDFRNVKGLVFRDLDLRNSHAFYVRLCLIDGFDFRRTRFFSEKRTGNQDGFHLNGFCRNGLIEDTEACSGQTDDDLFAFNADDILWREINYDMVCGPIENVTVRDCRFANLQQTGFFLAVRYGSDLDVIRGFTAEDIEFDFVPQPRIGFQARDGERFAGEPLTAVTLADLCSYTLGRNLDNQVNGKPEAPEYYRFIHEDIAFRNLRTYGESRDLYVRMSEQVPRHEIRRVTFEGLPAGVRVVTDGTPEYSGIGEGEYERLMRELEAADIAADRAWDAVTTPAVSGISRPVKSKPTAPVFQSW